MDLLTRHFIVSHEIFLRVELDPFDIRRSLKHAIVHELIETDLIVFDGDDFSLIVHQSGELRCLRSRRCTDIEDEFLSSGFECQHWNHGSERLKVYLPIIEGASSLDRIFMYSIEEIRSENRLE